MRLLYVFVPGDFAFTSGLYMIRV